MRKNGFTLIELMIVVAIISILASIAIPAYNDYIRKTRRTDAKVALLNYAQVLERLFTEQGSYSSATVGNAATDLIKSTSDQGFYSISLPTKTATTFSLEAQPTGSQTNDPCGTLTLNQQGIKGVSGGSLSASSCW